MDASPRQKAGQRWAAFNLREDQLNELRIGSRVELIPAGGDAPIYAGIDEIIPRGEFSTWRAARAVGDYDLNTFLIRADPMGCASAAAGALLPRPNSSPARFTSSCFQLLIIVG